MTPISRGRLSRGLRILRGIPGSSRSWSGAVVFDFADIDAVGVDQAERGTWLVALCNAARFRVKVDGLWAAAHRTELEMTGIVSERARIEIHVIEVIVVLCLHFEMRDRYVVAIHNPPAQPRPGSHLQCL